MSLEKYNTPTIGLCIITFNESKVLLRCLNSVLPIIDYYVIVDTGSSDNTKEIAKKFFDENGINGEIYDSTEFHMSKSLNLAFSKLKSKVDIAFYIDCDNVLSIPEGINIEEFKEQLLFHDNGEVTVDSGNLMYAKGLFYNLRNNWIWEGILHEVGVCEHPTTKYRTPLKLLIHNDGNSWTSQTQREKYLKHVNMFLKDIDENGLTSRNVFYLAQSYRDSGEKEEAIKWYTKRLSMIGFYEEVYVSQLNIANLKWDLGKPIWEVADEFMRCSEIDTLRAEHLFDLKSMYERNGRPQCAIKIGELLDKYKNPYPNRVLFINPNAYIDKSRKKLFKSNIKEEFYA